MIIITGATGFIGSVTVGHFNKNGLTDLTLYDLVSDGDQLHNLDGKIYTSINNTVPDTCDMVIHIGANSNTLETDKNDVHRTNVISTETWADYCLERNIPLIFTSTAAIFGNGTGPLNIYAESKIAAEELLLRKMENGLQCAILRLYNVYGPNEYHKGRMASTIFHWYNQLQTTKLLNIFENSHNFSRDFIYVEDVAETMFRLYKKFRSGIYQVGTGTSVSFETVADTLLSYIDGRKTYISMPDDLKKQYQTHTQADITELDFIVDTSNFKNIKQGIEEYIKYLSHKIYF